MKRNLISILFAITLLIPKINRLEEFLETSKLKLKESKTVETGYLFSKKELNFIIETYKSVFPLVHKSVKKKLRCTLFKKYKSYCKQLNKLLFYKELQRKSTIGELIEIKTGIAVSDAQLNKIKIKEIKQRSKLTDKEYIVLMHSLRKKIDHLETVMENSKTKIYTDGSKKRYYYVPEKSLL